MTDETLPEVLARLDREFAIRPIEPGESFPSDHGIAHLFRRLLPALRVFVEADDEAVYCLVALQLGLRAQVDVSACFEPARNAMVKRTELREAVRKALVGQ